MKKQVEKKKWQVMVAASSRELLEQVKCAEDLQ